jgi:hypothetical protein
MAGGICAIGAWAGAEADRTGAGNGAGGAVCKNVCCGDLDGCRTPEAE